MCRKFVDEFVTLLSQAAKAFHRKGGKFKAALVKGHVSWTSVVLALSRLGGSSCGSIAGRAAVLQVYLCLRVGVGNIQEYSFLLRYSEDGALVRAPGLMTISMLKFLSPVKGAPLSTSFCTLMPRSALDSAYFNGSCMLTCAPSRGQVRACIVVIVSPLLPR